MKRKSTLPKVSQLKIDRFQIGMQEVWLQNLCFDHCPTMPPYSPSRCSLSTSATIIIAPLRPDVCSLSQPEEKQRQLSGCKNLGH